MERKKVILLIGLLQVISVVLGFIALGVTMKMNGYPSEIGIRWNPFAVWMRTYGLFYMFIPLLWLAVVNLVKELKESLTFIFVTGAITALFIMICFIFAAVDSYYHPLLLSRM